MHMRVDQSVVIVVVRLIITLTPDDTLLSVSQCVAGVVVSRQTLTLSNLMDAIILCFPVLEGRTRAEHQLLPVRTFVIRPNQ